MEEMIHNLVKNTLKKENAEDIICERISWYEMQIKKRNDILNKIKEYTNTLLFELNRGKEFEKWEEILNPILYLLEEIE